MQSAVWSIWNGTVFCVEMNDEEGTSLHEDTEYLAREPLWEPDFYIPAMKEEDVKPGMILEEKTTGLRKHISVIASICRLKTAVWKFLTGTVTGSC